MSDQTQLQYKNLFGQNLIKYSLDDLETGCDIVSSMGLNRIKNIISTDEMPDETVLKAINTGINLSKHINQRITDKAKSEDKGLQLNFDEIASDG